MIRVVTPSRLHFGLLSLRAAKGAAAGARLGGVGVMVDRPGVALRLAEADRLEVSGPLADRAETFAKRFCASAGLNGQADGPAVRIHVERAPRQHVGLGTGTQLGMAVAQALSVYYGGQARPAAALARHIGRGRRSAVGLSGFESGGVVVDLGGAAPEDVFRTQVPSGWRFVLISPTSLSGINGRAEEQAFAAMNHPDNGLSGELKEIVLEGLLPAADRADLSAFGESLYVLQQRVGASYASVQGGVYADPSLERMVDFVRGCGVAGVGQSSWGPTLYAAVDGQTAGDRLAEQVRHEFGLTQAEVFVSNVSAGGARITSPSPHGAVR